MKRQLIISFLTGLAIGAIFGIYGYRRAVIGQLILGETYPTTMANRMSEDLRMLVSLESNDVSDVSTLLNLDLRNNVMFLESLGSKAYLDNDQKRDINMANAYISIGHKVNMGRQVRENPLHLTP